MNQKMKRQMLYRDFLQFFAVSIVFVVMFANPSWAQSNVGESMKDVRKGVCDLLKGLNILSMATVTIAIVWCGYKWLFKHSELTEIARIFIGAIFIGGGAKVGEMLLAANADAKAGDCKSA